MSIHTKRDASRMIENKGNWKIKSGKGGKLHHWKMKVNEASVKTKCPQMFYIKTVHNTQKVFIAVLLFC